LVNNEEITVFENRTVQYFEVWFRKKTH
jgi:hypothetical protein